MSAYYRANWRIAAYLALAAISAIVLTSVSALANGTSQPASPVEPEELAPIQPAQPAQTGAGCLTSASASNVATNAWIYTTQNWVTANPQPVTGNAQVFACTTPSGTSAAAATPSADVVASFNYPTTGGSQYVVRFTCVLQNQMGFEGVSVLKPIFGSLSQPLLGMALPRTLAYIAVLGNATITKDGTTLTENQPAMILVTQAIHDPMHRLLTEGDPSRREIHLIVPGALMPGGSAVAGFPVGAFYVYWPDAAVNISNVGGRVQLSALPEGVVTTPGMAARGPVAAMPLRITITNTGIQKSAELLPEGLYRVTITNKASKPRGVSLTGTDICCTEFNRFSKILKPGQSQTFRFVFAQGKVLLRDMTKCERRERTCAVATYGPHSTSITFR